MSAGSPRAARAAGLQPGKGTLAGGSVLQAPFCYPRGVSDRRRTKPEVPADKPQEGRDVAFIHGVSPAGDELAVVRVREDRVEAGVVRALKEGEPLEGEVVRLKPRPEMPFVCDVEVEVPRGVVNARGGSERSGRSHGPAQVATPRYRANWDAIWNKPKGKEPLPN